MGFVNFADGFQRNTEAGEIFRQPDKPVDIPGREAALTGPQIILFSQRLLYFVKNCRAFAAVDVTFETRHLSQGTCHFPYCSSLTFSIQSTAFPSSAS